MADRISSRRHGPGHRGRTLLAAALAIGLSCMPVPEGAQAARLNPDDGALAQGVLFHPDLPERARRLIVSDILWLADSAPAAAIGSLAGKAGLLGDAARLSLLNRLLNRVKVVAAHRSCLSEGLGVSTVWRESEHTFRALRSDYLDRHEKRFSGFLCPKGDLGGAVAASGRPDIPVTSLIVDLKTTREIYQRYALRIGDAVVEIPGPQAGIVFVDPAAYEALPRAGRIAALLDATAEDEPRFVPNEAIPAEQEEDDTTAYLARLRAAPGGDLPLQRAPLCGSHVDCRPEKLHDPRQDILLASAPVDFRLVRHPDTRALAAGLHFHSSVPLEVRRMLVEDIAWLWRQGPAGDTRELARLISATGPVTGADLVTWMLNRARVVVGHGACIVNHRGYLSTESGRLVFKPRGAVMERQFGRVGGRSCRPPEENLGGSRENYGESFLGLGFDGLAAVQVDGAVMPVLDTHDNPIFLVHDYPPFRREGWPGRIYRLMILLHEAAHAHTDRHAACQATGLENALPNFTTDLEKVRFGRPAGDLGCDVMSGAVYALAAEFMKYLLDACRDCTLPERIEVAEDVWRTSARVLDPAPLDRAGLVKRRLDAAAARIPMRWKGDMVLLEAPGHLPTAVTLDRYGEYVALLRQACAASACSPAMEATLAELASLAEDLAEIIRPMRRPERQLGLALASGLRAKHELRGMGGLTKADARAWVETALRAEPEGWNTPNTSLIPCSAVRGCVDEWSGPSRPPAAEPPPPPRATPRPQAPAPAPAPAAGPESVTVTDGSAGLHQGPGAHYPSKGLRKGATGRVEKRSRDWLLITTDGETGWVHEAFVSVQRSGG